MNDKNINYLIVNDEASALDEFYKYFNEASKYLNCHMDCAFCDNYDCILNENEDN